MHFGLDCKIWCFLTFFLFLHVFTRFEKIDIENIPFLLWPETYLLQDLLLVVSKRIGLVNDLPQVKRLLNVLFKRLIRLGGLLDRLS